MEKVFLHGLMVTSMKVNGKVICKMVLGSKLLPMEDNMKEPGIMTNIMVTGNWLEVIVQNTLVIGLKEGGMEKVYGL